MRQEVLTPANFRLPEDVEHEPEAPPVPARNAHTAIAPEDRVNLDQAGLDELIRKAQGRAAAETRLQLAATTARLKQLEAEKRAADPNATDAERLQAEAQSLKMENQQLRESQRRAQTQSDMMTFILAENFVDPTMTWTLTRDRISWDAEQRRYVVSDESGAPTEQTPQAFYKQWAEEHPFLVKGQVRPGAGSSEAAQHGQFEAIPLEKLFGAGSDARLVNKMALQNPTKYKTARAEAVRRGLCV